MATAYFKINLSLDTKGGKVKLIPPKVLSDVNFNYLVIREGGNEAIIKIDDSSDLIKEIDENKDCEKLTTEQMESTIKSYPPPKTKQKYRTRNGMGTKVGSGTQEEMYVLDEKGNTVEDTIQTVRSGYHLIDVIVSEE